MGGFRVRDAVGRLRCRLEGRQRRVQAMNVMLTGMRLVSRDRVALDLAVVGELRTYSALRVDTPVAPLIELDDDSWKDLRDAGDAVTILLEVARKALRMQSIDLPVILAE